jgi:hypothetical protein
MFGRTLKTVAVATAVVLATAGASLAASYAWVDHDTYLYEKHKSSSNQVGYAWEGQKVKVLNTWNNWVKIKANGDIGWVKENKLDWAPFPVVDPYYGGGYGSGSFCAGGNNASFCLTVGY